MTGPVVTVTRDDTRDPLRIEWFEDEAGYYAGDPLAWIEYDRGRDTWRGHAGRNAPREVALTASRVLLDLSCDAEVSVRYLATHHVPEPGAPLEPIGGTSA